MVVKRKVSGITLLAISYLLLLSFVILPHHHHQSGLLKFLWECSDTHDTEEHSHGSHNNDANNCLNHKLFTSDFSKKVRRNLIKEISFSKIAINEFSVDNLVKTETVNLVCNGIINNYSSASPERKSKPRAPPVV